MKYIKILLVFLFTLSLITISVSPLYAATLRSGDRIFIPESQKDLHDLYLFGGTITTDAPVENDLVIAGGNLTLNGDVSGSLMAAGGDIVIRSNVGNTMRVAGGNVTISGHVNRDLLIAAGTARITKTASISGDVLFAGGRLDVEGPIQGKIYANGGEVFINSTVGGNIEGDMEALSLGEQAIVNGDVRYRSDNKAAIDQGAIIRGTEYYQKTENPKKEESRGLAAAFTIGTLYKLALDIIVSLLLITFLSVFVKNVLEKTMSAPLASAGKGFIVLFFWPLISLFLLLLIWIGIASFLLYGLLLLFSLFLSKVLLGVWLLRFWEKRQNKSNAYTLDWRAGVVGPIVFFILFLIPIIGWLAVFVIFLMALGGTVQYLFTIAKTQRETKLIK